MNLKDYYPSDKDFDLKPPSSQTATTSYIPINPKPPRKFVYKEPNFLHQQKSYANKNPVPVKNYFSDEDEAEEEWVKPAKDQSSLTAIPSSDEILETQIKEKEVMINEKKALILEIINSVKLDKTELEELKKKRDYLQEKEINQGLEQMFGPQQQSKMMKI